MCIKIDSKMKLYLNILNVKAMNSRIILKVLNLNCLDKTIFTNIRVVRKTDSYTIITANVDSALNLNELKKKDSNIASFQNNSFTVM